METTAFEKIQDMYFTLDRNFNTFFAACKNDAERDELRMNYVKSRDAFWEGRTKVFSENDPMIGRTSAELAETKTRIDSDLASLHLTANTLRLVTAATNLTASLIAFA